MEGIEYALIANCDTAGRANTNTKQYSVLKGEIVTNRRFTYFLTAGLEGLAAANGDGIVRVGELWPSAWRSAPQWVWLSRKDLPWRGRHTP